MIDIREIICALSNTIPSFYLKDKCSFRFGLFASGISNEFISETELHIILAGTRLKRRKCSHVSMYSNYHDRLWFHALLTTHHLLFMRLMMMIDDIIIFEIAMCNK